VIDKVEHEKKESEQSEQKKKKDGMRILKKVNQKRNI